MSIRELVILIVVLSIIRLVIFFSERKKPTTAEETVETTETVKAASAETTEAVKKETVDKSTYIKNQIKEYLDAIIIAGVAALFLITFVVRTFYIPSESMVPTLQVKDRILVFQLPYITKLKKPHHGDVIVFRPPIPDYKGVDYIKRVAAVEGDVIYFKGNTFYRNGKPVIEPYLNEKPDYSDFEGKEQKIPPGNLFMMGDNRQNSKDSRYFGFVSSDKVVGKAFLIFWPLNRFKLIK